MMQILFKNGEVKEITLPNAEVNKDQSIEDMIIDVEKSAAMLRIVRKDKMETAIPDQHYFAWLRMAKNFPELLPNDFRIIVTDN